MIPNTLYNIGNRIELCRGALTLIGNGTNLIGNETNLIGNKTNLVSLEANQYWFEANFYAFVHKTIKYAIPQTVVATIKY